MSSNNIDCLKDEIEDIFDKKSNYFDSRITSSFELYNPKDFVTNKIPLISVQINQILKEE
jgi:hypothetical protein